MGDQPPFFGAKNSPPDCFINAPTFLAPKNRLPIRAACFLIHKLRVLEPLFCQRQNRQDFAPNYPKVIHQETRKVGATRPVSRTTKKVSKKLDTFLRRQENRTEWGVNPHSLGLKTVHWTVLLTPQHFSHHVKNLFCLPDKRGFLQLYPFLPERVIYLRYDIALRAMIYAFGIWRNGYYIMLAAGKYIIRQRRISYCASDISLKSAAKRDIICSIKKNLTENT